MGQNEYDNTCNYCGEYTNYKDPNHIRLQLETIDALILIANFCSEECLKKTLDLGAVILDQDCTPEILYKDIASYIYRDDTKI